MNTPFYGPLPPVSNRSYWYHNKASGQYWATEYVPFTHLIRRAPKAHTHGLITTVRQLKETLRGSDYAWPGGYPMYLITDDGGALHFKCAREQYREIVETFISHYSSTGWKIVGCEINDEDNSLYCDHCDERIETSYEPDEDDVTDEDDDS